MFSETRRSGGHEEEPMPLREEPGSFGCLLLGCLRPLLSRKTTGGEGPPVVPRCLIAATQLVACQVFHAVGASLYLHCVLRIGSQIRRGGERNRLVRVVL